jgi:hypothetical protein
MAYSYFFPDSSDPTTNSIKTWITFWAADYSTFSYNRIPNQIISDAHTSITLPYPGVFNTQNQQEYSNMPSPQIKSMELGIMGSLQQSLIGTMEKAESFMRGGNIITFDHMETVLMPGGRRTHRFEFTLVAKTNASLKGVSNIPLVFQALMHPGANTSSIYTQTHPSIWVFCAGSSPRSSAGYYYDDDLNVLDGFSPACVLAACDINRSPIQNIPYTVNVDGKEVPLAVNIKLSFMELEPSLRRSGSDRVIISRSQR